MRFEARLGEGTLDVPGGVPSGEVEGVVDGFPFRAALEADGRLEVSPALRQAIGAQVGDMVTVELTRAAGEAEVRLPADLREALSAVPAAEATWSAITPMARRDWVLWILTARQAPTRSRRIEKACSMLAGGKKRVCCFGGLNWLVKDHPAVKTWAPLK